MRKHAAIALLLSLHALTLFAQDVPDLIGPTRPGAASEPTPVLDLDEESIDQAQTQDPVMPPGPAITPPPPATSTPVPDSAGTPDAPEPGLTAAEGRELDQRADALISEALGENFQTTDSVQYEQTVPLSLRQVVAMALKSNLEISVEQLNPIIAESDLLNADGIFDPNLVGNASYQENSQPIVVSSFTGFSTVAGGQRTGLYDIGVEQLTPIGGTLDFGTDSRNSMRAGNQFENEFTSFVGLGYDQPLLQGFGTDVTLGPIRIARRSVSAADAGFEFEVEGIVTDVAQAYYELIFTRNDYVARQKSLGLAEQTLRDNTARVEIGVMSPLDVSQARSEVAQRRDELLQARRAIRDQENVLKRLITAEVADWLTKRVYPTTIPPTDYNAPPITSSVAIALDNRADLREAKYVLEQRGIQVDIAKNGLLPTLNLNSEFGHTGVSNNFGETYGDVVTKSDPTWIVQLTFSVPIGNREARGDRDAALAREQQAVLGVKQLEQDIIIEVDNAAGQARTNAERVRASRAARKFAEEALQAEQEKLNAGTSTSFVVLQLQRDLTDVRIRELRAIADLQASLADLARVQGRALEAFGVEIVRDGNGLVRRMAETEAASTANAKQLETDS